MRTHERKKVLMECEAMEAREIEVFILKTLDDHPLAANNPVAIIAGLSNALLTIATRMDVEKESFFLLLATSWDHYQTAALDEENNGRVH